jgi:dihydrofolate reductase
MTVETNPLTSQVEISIIAAVSANGVIGKNGELPWEYSEDLQHFNSVTIGSPVIMGRVTYENIIEKNGEPLEGRTSIVLTNSPERVVVSGDGDVSELTDASSVHVASRVEEALGMAGAVNSDVVYIAGGQSVYEEFLPVADELVLTHVDAEIDGDAYFPDWSMENWRVEDSRDGETEELTFKSYKRTAESATSE